MNHVTDTLDAAAITIVRAALEGQLTSAEAVKRIRRAQELAQVARYGVVVEDDEIDAMRKRLGLAL